MSGTATRMPARLPTLMPGISRLPTACQHCGSHLLNAEPPLGEHQRGLITCSMCSRQLCWLVAPLRSPRSPDSLDAAAGFDSRPQVMPRTERTMLTVGFDRLPSCGTACSRKYGHHALTHEEHGRAMALAAFASRLLGVVRTGRLSVGAEDGAFVDGRAVPLTTREFQLLLFLAGRLGQVCSHAEIVTAVWGPAELRLMLRTGKSAAWHNLRVVIARLRKGLGSAASLVETVPNRGIRLRAEPPIEEAP